MQAGKLKKILESYKDEDQIAVVFCEYEDFEMSYPELTREQWSKLVAKMTFDAADTELTESIDYALQEGEL